MNMGGGDKGSLEKGRIGKHFDGSPPIMPCRRFQLTSCHRSLTIFGHIG